MNRTTRKLWRILPFGLAFMPVLSLTAQDDDDEEEIIELNPFEVSASDMEGYSATATLAGTRIKTDLRDVASSISVVTDQFLQDTGATDTQSLLVYTPSTEVGGLQGNFGGLGNNNAISDNSSLTSPSTNTRVRGLAEADNTRDFFLTDIPWDSYNVDRVDLQRGPNSILFGVGSPAGIINTSTIPAVFQDQGEIEFRFDEENSLRASLDINREIIEDLLAIRVAGLIDHQNYQQEPAYEDDERLYLAVRYEPRLFGSDHGPLSIRANFESGEIDANRPRYLPPYDHVSPWFDRLNKEVFDPQYSWNHGEQLDRGTRVLDDTSIAEPGLGQQIPGFLGQNPAFYFGSNTAANDPLYFRQFQSSGRLGRGADGEIDQDIAGFPFARMQWPAGLFEYSQNANALDSTLFPAATKGFYKNQVMMDPSIFDFYNKLIDGEAKREWSDWTAYNVSIAQTFFGGRVGAEFVYDYQDLTRGRDGLLSGINPYIAVDINSYWPVGPDPVLTGYEQVEEGFPDKSTVTGGVPNPFVARAFTAGDGYSGNNEENLERENIRFTVFGELRADDFLDPDSLLAEIIGRHRFTGLASQDERRRAQYGWQMYATDVFVDLLDRNASINNRDVAITSAFYLSGDLSGVNSASGLNLDRIQGDFQPHGQYTVSYFDETWDPMPGVGPGDEYIRPIDGAVQTQSENPLNYVGWSTTTANVLNARMGDLDQLIRNSSKRYERVTSVGLTWQGFFWDGVIVPTVGWRQDKVKGYGGESPLLDPTTQLKTRDFQISDEDAARGEGELLSWGVVLRTPDFIRRQLPAGTDISLFYNDAENFVPETRYGYNAKLLPNSSGTTEEYGFVLSALDERVTLKVAWYETQQLNANLGNVPLGQNSWYLWNQEAWGTAASIIHETWRRGEAPGMGWYSNWAQPDDGFAYDAEELPPEGFDHPSFVAQAAAIADWYATMPSQEWFDAYGYPINVAAAQSPDFETRRTAVTDPNWNVYQGIGGIQPAGGGSINGFSPTGTIDQVSEGMEIELSAQPMPNWNLTLNVTQTDAYRGQLGSAITEWIESRRERFEGPAGDIRQWWAGDRNTRQFFNDFIWAPYQFQLESVGQSAPEIREWRFNLVTTYNFTEGFMEGTFVGGGYRWMDDVILGYELDDTLSKLDVNRPIYGGSENYLDLWVGYSRELTDTVDWRIQLNVRNVGKDDHLVPISVNPDGQIAAARIVEGMNWFITNTFSF